MTADGVIGITFSGARHFGQSQIAGLGIPTGTETAYIHNSHGWFQLLERARGARHRPRGRRLGTDRSGDHRHPHGRWRGPGVRAGPPTGCRHQRSRDPSRVSSWNCRPGSWRPSIPCAPPLIIQRSLAPGLIGNVAAPSSSVNVFLADGSYVHINAAGFERGLYRWAGNAAGGRLEITTLYDTNGGNGLSFHQGRSGLTLITSGDTSTISDTGCLPCASARHRPTGPRRAGFSSSVRGRAAGCQVSPTLPWWSCSTPAAGNRYFGAFDQPGGAEDGGELGTYTWDPVSS